MSELVSVIIPSYNREKLIEKSIKSVLNQSYKNIEIIVVDDNSSDNTESVVKSLQDKYEFIKYIRHETNKGGSAARNSGVKVALGELIAFLDSDDEWVGNKLEKNLEIFHKNDKVAMVYSDMYLVNADTAEEKLNKSKKYDDKYYGLLCENIIGSTSLIMIKKDVFNNVGGFKEGLPSCQDWDFYLNVAKENVIEKIDEPLLKYYIHQNSISGNLDRALKGHKIIFEKVLSILEENEKASKMAEIIKLYPQVLINAKVNSEKKYDYDKDSEIKDAIEKLEKEFAGNGRVLIRPSGTEPLVRVMIEGEDQKYITQKAKEIAKLIEEKLK